MKIFILLSFVLLNSCAFSKKVAVDSRKAICRESCADDIYKGDLEGQKSCLNRCNL